MRKLSIKLRVTLWYAVFMVVLVGLVLLCILSISNSILKTSGQTQLKDVVYDAFKEIEYKDGQILIDDDLDYFQNGIYLSVYDVWGNLLYGRTPNGFDPDTPMAQDTIQTVGGTDSPWYVYDIKMNIDNQAEARVRGVVSLSGMGNSIDIIIRLAMAILPFIVLVALIGGYLITKRAFIPVTRITAAAEQISSGKDLSQRINLQGGKDEIYKLAETFDRMFDRLERSFEAEKQFTADASHELRTPTAVISTQCEEALRHTKNPADTQKALQVIWQQTKKMTGLIGQLLMMARTEAAEQKLELELINLSETAQMVIDEQRLAAARKGIEIDAQIEPDLMLYADQTMMMRVFINLIDNAITYGRTGGRIKVTLRMNRDAVKGAVWDDGIGISEEHLDKIWNRFFQVDPSRSGDKGAGLGLPMVKWIVEAHGGLVSVRSTIGEGSRFEFTLKI